MSEQDAQVQIKHALETALEQAKEQHEQQRKILGDRLKQLEEEKQALAEELEALDIRWKQALQQALESTGLDTLLEPASKTKARTRSKTKKTAATIIEEIFKEKGTSELRSKELIQLTQQRGIIKSTYQQARMKLQEQGRLQRVDPNDRGRNVLYRWVG